MLPMASYRRGFPARRSGMLRYCQTVLRKCRKIYVAASQNNSKTSDSCKVGTTKVDNNDGISDRFEALKVNDDEQEESEEVDDLHIERPSQPGREYSIEKDLIEGDDTMHAKSFVFQTNMLMQMVVYHFKTLKGKIEHIKKSHLELGIEYESSSLADSGIASHTMICSACVNLALEEIKFLEVSLVAEAPSLKSYYHVIARLIYPSFVKNLEESCSRESLRKNSSIALDFVAKAVEYGFRTPADDGYNKVQEDISKVFSKQTKIDGKMCLNVFVIIQSLTTLEVAPWWVLNDKRLQPIVNHCRKNLDQFCNMTGNTPSGWSNFFVAALSIPGMNEDDVKGILQSQSRLQAIVKSFPSIWHNQIMSMDPSIQFSESKWDEKLNPAGGINDPKIDDYFYGTFHVPFTNRVSSKESQTLFDSCFGGLLPQFFPLLQGYVKYLKDGDSTVPYSLTLTVHAMIFGVLHLQGDLERIAMASKNVSEKYYSQIQFVIDHSDPTECNIPYLQRIKASQVASKSDETNKLALWNPLCAGCFLLQITYLQNLMLSARTLDLNNEMVIVLHLLNAFKVRKIIQDDGIKYLEQIETALSSSKAIWGEQKPMCSFISAFLIATGDPISASKKVADFVVSMPWHQMNDAIKNVSEERFALFKAMCRQNIELDGDTNIHLERMKMITSLSRCEIFTGGTRKQARTIQPDDLSSSYKLIVKQDFSKVLEDNDYVGNEVPIMSIMGILSMAQSHYPRQEAIQKSAIEDLMHGILQINLTKLSWVLNNAVKKLVTHMGWDNIITACCSQYPTPESGENTYRRFFEKILLGDRILGELDSETDNSKCCESRKAAAFLVNYFNSLEKEDVYFF